MAATALTESAAAFEKQAAALGLDAEWLAGLKAQQITTFGRLAFSCGQPGTAVADADVRTLLQSAAPAKAITVGDMAIMKRLIFEAQTAVIALARASADPNADPSARKMPQVSVENTKKRKEDLISQIEAALIKGHLSSSEASSLKGRLGFAEGACNCLRLASMACRTCFAGAWKAGFGRAGGCWRGRPVESAAGALSKARRRKWHSRFTGSRMMMDIPEGDVNRLFAEHDKDSSAKKGFL
eukprot:Skav209485  [mRNA]  locus=scaffold1892:145566:159359:+ [translate_table: standard]